MAIQETIDMLKIETKKRDALLLAAQQAYEAKKMEIFKQTYEKQATMVAKAIA